MSTGAEGRVTCEACGKTYRWRPDLAGRKVKCGCGAVMTMPAADPGQAEAMELELNLDGPPAAAAAPAPPSRPATEKRPAPAAPAAARAAAKPGSLAPPLPSEAEIAPAAEAKSQCPSCNAAVKPEAVICVACGFNIKEGRKLQTQTGGRAISGPRPGGARRNVGTPDPDGFFGRIARSWEFTKISYGILWDFKQLLVFPIFSFASALLVLASFLLPLWGTGTLQDWARLMDDQSSGGSAPVTLYVVAFAFYFCNYFVIVFFNTALTACAMKVTSGEVPSLGYGLAVAMKRLPQIAAWALVSAVVGVILKVIENAHEKAGRIIAAILGSAWTILTYFVVPVICVEGVGPLTAFKRSVRTLADTWGEGLVGNVTLGLISFLITLPVLVVAGVVVMLALGTGSLVLITAALTLAVVVILVAAAANSAADGVFRALLYNYATGKSLPADIDETVFAGAFGSRGVMG